MERNKQKVILSDGKELTLRKLPLRHSARLMLVFDGIVGEIANEWEDVSNDEIIEKLPQFLGKHFNRVGTLIEVLTEEQITADEALDERGIDDAVTIISAGISVNRVQEMVKNVKKAIATAQNKSENQLPKKS